MKSTFHVLGWVVSGLVYASSAFAGGNIPVCLNMRGQALPVMNNTVVQWKFNSPSQYKDRALVEGVVTQAFEYRGLKGDHDRFEIAIGSNQKDTIEVVYNSEFGELPNIKPGMSVSACGEYITANARAGKFPPSPSGAIIHWVHQNPRYQGVGSGMPNGFVVIEGTLYGYNQSEENKRRHGINFEIELNLKEMLFPDFAFSHE